MLGRLRQKEDVKPKKTFETVGVQVDTPGSDRGVEIPGRETDDIVPWDSPSLQQPICSWSTFPLEPSSNLKSIVDFFAAPPGDSPPLLE